MNFVLWKLGGYNLRKVSFLTLNRPIKKCAPFQKKKKKKKKKTRDIATLYPVFIFLFSDATTEDPNNSSSAVVVSIGLLMTSLFALFL